MRLIDSFVLKCCGNDVLFSQLTRMVWDLNLEQIYPKSHLGVFNVELRMIQGGPLKSSSENVVEKRNALSFFKLSLSGNFSS